MPRYASLIYNGYWWSPERKMLQTMIDASQATVNGWVRVKLYKGNVDRRRPRVEDRFAVRPDDRHLRGRPRRLRSEGRRRIHQAQRLAPAHRGEARAQEVSHAVIRHRFRSQSGRSQECRRPGQQGDFDALRLQGLGCPRRAQGEGADAVRRRRLQAQAGDRRAARQAHQARRRRALAEIRQRSKK